VAEEAIRLNRDFLGKEYHSGPQIIEPDSIRRYALATNEKNPRYLSAKSDVDIVPPPLYSVVFLPGILDQLVNDAEQMQLNILRVVHAEHQMIWKDVFRVGDQIHTTAKIVNMESRGTNEILDLLIHCKRKDVVVVEMNYRLLIRGKKKEGEEKASKEPLAPEKGKVVVKHKTKVTADQGVRYAQASGDHNPIHVSDEIARSVGLPRAILHGLCTMALASQAIVDGLIKGDPTQLKSMSVRFSRPVLLNQTLTTEVYEGGTGTNRRHMVHFETRDESEVPVLIFGLAELGE